MVFEDKSLKMKAKYVKILQGFILSQMKLLGAWIYFDDNFHFNNRESPVNRMQKQPLERVP